MSILVYFDGQFYGKDMLMIIMADRSNKARTYVSSGTIITSLIDDRFSADIYVDSAKAHIYINGNKQSFEYPDDFRGEINDLLVKNSYNDMDRELIKRIHNYNSAHMNLIQ